MKNKQITNSILMIEPIAFYYNAETAENNYFQQKPSRSSEKIQTLALSEFNAMVEKLRSHGINVFTIQDTKEPHTPDSIFPNNWISMHENAQIALFPMFAENRRPERRDEILDFLEEKGFAIDAVTDFSAAEQEDIFLEGTGSMILDRENRYAYAALSPRTDEGLFIEFCEDFEFTPISFTANQTVDGERMPIYHTNVMMCLADKYAIICLDSIDDKKEKKNVVETLKETGKEIIKISDEQMHQFAGNMLQVLGKDDQPYLVMSETAYQSLKPEQIQAIEKYNPIISVAIPTIEKLGGGSARCMMAEIYLPKAE
ncbi:amidinotransferase [Ornithobacterium rhinotracheale]|uniref:citrulline utilization hydrolase CtlX n=1 Tax=Ornithobacterium rhinotracheale TaxID=28251 RepID=UPI00129C1411|nr:arginine deiminase-related protein [Ornithobacterium rhinotracheale]MRI63610.1 amidinotransferase [Ornithobacterium rhinotracheale]MRJ08990.1 amidinotransferase [Ornithobacterium rhinotracheale]MRJ10491.1 amidinotransferase [Ornithobacterium rhinotracheale]UOH78888.1 arginine deiminase-related protein [Ornithobacterium rhinotracheale]